MGDRNNNKGWANQFKRNTEALKEVSIILKVSNNKIFLIRQIEEKEKAEKQQQNEIIKSSNCGATKYG